MLMHVLGDFNSFSLAIDSIVLYKDSVSVAPIFQSAIRKLTFFTHSKNIQVCRFSVLNALKTVCHVLNHVL